jgi:hypothetical protein
VVNSGGFGSVTGKAAMLTHWPDLVAPTTARGVWVSSQRCSGVDLHAADASWRKECPRMSRKTTKGGVKKEPESSGWEPTQLGGLPTVVLPISRQLRRTCPWP